MKIIIGADIFATASNLKFFESGNIVELIGEDLNKSLKDADFRLFNLEGPITESNISIEKCGPNIKMPSTVITGIEALRPSLLTLANNHIMDYGKAGYEDTVKILSSKGINIVGTGNNIETIKKSHFLEKNGIKIGVYSCAEHEFSIATKNYPGANPYDPLNTFDDVYNLKQKCDYVIVLYHGGKECYRYPSPELQRCFRKMADKGADFVVAQHTHCVGCEEKYKNSTLLYGQGNFIFDDGEDMFWNNGMLTEIEITNKSNINIHYLPYRKNNGRIRFCKDDNSLLNDFYKRSEQIQTPGFVENTFKDFSEHLFSQYLNAVHGKDIFYSIFRKIFGTSFVNNIYYKREFLNRMKNYIDCECHREVFLSALSK